MRKLVLWGHQLDEYRDMFALTADDLRGSLLEYGCGSSAINAQLHLSAKKIVSCDPLFTFAPNACKEIVEQGIDARAQQLLLHKEQFDFSRYGSLAEFVAYRRSGLAKFFADYKSNDAKQRYLPTTDLRLPFKDFTFDLALSSHYLFADEDKQDVTYHLDIIRELVRVAREVRIFPLIDHLGQPSPLLGPVLLGLQQENYGVEVCEVAYQLQPLGHAMLRVMANQCVLNKQKT